MHMFSRKKYIWKNAAHALALAMLLAMVSIGLSCSEKTAPEPNQVCLPEKITLLFFNDLHGHLAPFKRRYGDTRLSGGFARLGHVVKKIRKENEEKGIETILLSAGDNFQGTPMSTAFKGKAEFEVFNAIKLDATAVGNHDFDFGADNLFDLLQVADFVVLSSNIFELDGSEGILTPFLAYETRKGSRIGIIGLTTPETPVTTHPSNVFNIRFAHAELAMQRHFKALQEESDCLVVLSHLGIRNDKILARQYPAIDLILGGHSHSILTKPLSVGDVKILHAGDRGLYLGRIDLEVEKDHVTLQNAYLIPIDDTLPEDETIKKIIKGYHDKLSSEIGKVIGRTTHYLDGERENVRTRETNLGSFVADLMRLRAGTDVAFINGGAIRASFMPGSIKLEDVMRSLPMNNDITRMDLKGEGIYLALKRSIQGLVQAGEDSLFGGFLQVSGLQFSIENGKVKNILIAGKPINLFQTYSVATVDFLAAGGDGYKEFKSGSQKYNTGVALRDLFVDYLKEHEVVEAKTEGRIIRVK